MARIDLPEDWRDRLADYADKMTRRQVAEYFGVSESVMKRWIETDVDFGRLFKPEPPMKIPKESKTLDVIDDLLFVTDVPRSSHCGRECVMKFDAHSLHDFLRRLRDEFVEHKRQNQELVQQINGSRFKLHAQKAGGRPVHARGDAS